MFTHRLIISEKTPDNKLLAELEKQCEINRVPTAQAAALLSETSSAINTLRQIAESVSHSGGQFRGQKEIKTDAVRVVLSAEFGTKRSFLGRIAQCFRRARR